MNKYLLVTVGIFFIIISVVLAFQYIFSIYEIDYFIEKRNLKIGESVRILARPLNSLGFKAPFRKIKVIFSVQQGNELVDIQETEDGVLITAKLQGDVIINTHSNMAILDSQIKLTIK